MALLEKTSKTFEPIWGGWLKDRSTMKFKYPTNAQGERGWRKDIITYKAIVKGYKVDENAINFER